MVLYMNQILMFIYTTMLFYTMIEIQVLTDYKKMFVNYLIYYSFKSEIILPQF